MIERVAALLFALVLLGAGLATAAQAQALTMAVAVSVAAQIPADSPPIDELPAAGQGESVPDAQALWMEPVRAPACALVMARPRPLVAGTPPAPCLERPQRPPRATPPVVV